MFIKKLILGSLTILLIISSSPSYATIELQRGAGFLVLFPYTISSEEASEGMPVAIEAAEDFIVSGKTIIKSGTRGFVNVEEIKGRKIALGAGSISASNGEKLPIILNKKAKGKGVAGNAAFWIGLLLFWPALLFIKTKDGKIAAGTTAMVFLSQDKNLNL